MHTTTYHVGMVEMIACLVWCTALGQQPNNVSPILEEHPCSRHGDCYSCVSDPCSRTDDNSPFACVWCANGAAADEGACIPSSSSRECDLDKLSVSVKDCLDHGSRLAAPSMREPTPQHLQDGTCGMIMEKTYYVNVSQKEDAYDEQHDSGSTFRTHLNICRNVTNQTVVQYCGSRAPLETNESNNKNNVICWNIGTVSKNWNNAFASKVIDDGVSFKLELGTTPCCPHGNQPGECVYIPVRIIGRPGNCGTIKPWRIEGDFKKLTQCNQSDSLDVTVVMPHLCSDTIMWRLDGTNMSSRCSHASNGEINCTVAVETLERGKSLSPYLFGESFVVERMFVEEARKWKDNSTLSQLGRGLATTDGHNYSFTLSGINSSLCNLRLFYTDSVTSFPVLLQFDADKNCLQPSPTANTLAAKVGGSIGAFVFIATIVGCIVWIRRVRGNTRPPRGFDYREDYGGIGYRNS